jgi:hypothetical protein
MAALLTQLGPWLLAFIGLLLAFAAINTARAAARSRRAAYYALRQEAIAQMRRWALVSLVLLGGAGALIIVLASPPRPPAAAIVNTATPARIVTPPTPTPQPSSTATATATMTPSPNPSPTNTPLPTATPEPGVPDLLLTPLPDTVAPAPDARLILTTLASVLDNNNNPLDPGQVFPVGTKRIRIFFQAAQVDNGVTWSVLCYKDQQLVDSVIGRWKWGTRTQNARAFCAIDGSVGKYRVAGYLGMTKQFAMDFDVIEPPTLTPTTEVNVTPEASAAPQS